ncbi:hypothetical protein Cfla_2991 [Cellulomonas flavigena DSM 20109]|uniref:Uncharacterized protein n=2 Tax=Cellulomonas flavigena TaxID=1711 RepID=D5UKZ2_CELFN|nr:hypothetical protein Cfla_2991 [Cellulomonas flavigena DSM 20109]
MLMRILDAEWRYPDEEHWVSWDPGDRIDAVAAELARRVATTPTGAAHLHRSIVAVNRSALTKGNTVGQSALWIPDPGTGEVRGVVEVSVSAFTHPRQATPEAFVARNWRRDYGGWRVRITERAAEVFECQAGRGVVETIVGRLRGERTVQAYSSFFVFPHDGTPEAVQLAFNTVHLDQLVELTTLGRSITDSLEITTGPAT